MKYLKTFTGKTEVRWLGPYRVSEILGNGSVRLEELDGTKMNGTYPPDQIKLYIRREAGEVVVSFE